MSQDTIADLLTQIRNAYMANRPGVLMKYTKMRARLVKILLDEGYLREVKIGSLKLNPRHAFEEPFIRKSRLELSKKRVADKRKTLKVIKIYGTYCGHNLRVPMIDGIKRISKPGKRIYYSSKDLPLVCNGFGISIVSTPGGIMTDKQARKKGLGGEVLCEVW